MRDSQYEVSEQLACFSLSSVTLKGKCYHGYWWESDWIVIFVLLLLLLLSGIWVLWEGLNCNEHSQHWLYCALNPSSAFNSVGVVLNSTRCGYKHPLTSLVLHRQRVSPVWFSRMCAEEWRRRRCLTIDKSNKMHSCYNGSSQNVVLEEVGVSGNCSLRLWNTGQPRVTSGSKCLSEVLWPWESAGFSNVLVLFI